MSIEIYPLFFKYGLIFILIFFLFEFEFLSLPYFAKLNMSLVGIKFEVFGKVQRTIVNN